MNCLESIMKIDYAIILAAGKGTRMGEIGKVLPKVLWPIFEKPIIELEVLYAQKLGAINIYTNVFNHKEIILPFLKSNLVTRNIDVLIENEVLDVGGAIHNLAKQVNYKGNLLILNCDQFIMLSQQELQLALERLNSNDSVLFTYQVPHSSGYNKLNINENSRLLEQIISNKEILDQDSFETYTGMSLIKLESLQHVEGESKFFDSVANPKSSKVFCQDINMASYWDFGTTRRYYQSMFEALEERSKSDPFIEFLEDNDSLDRKKINALSYNSKTNMGINLSDIDVYIGKKSIILNLTHKAQYNDGFNIVYNEIIQPIDD